MGLELSEEALSAAVAAGKPAVGNLPLAPRTERMRAALDSAPSNDITLISATKHSAGASGITAPAHNEKEEIIKVAQSIVTSDKYLALEQKLRETSDEYYAFRDTLDNKYRYELSSILAGTNDRKHHHYNIGQKVVTIEEDDYKSLIAHEKNFAFASQARNEYIAEETKKAGLFDDNAGLVTLVINHTYYQESQHIAQQNAHKPTQSAEQASPAKAPNINTHGR